MRSKSIRNSQGVDMFIIAEWSNYSYFYSLSNHSKMTEREN